ncbi:MAG TPA: hypothetical protein VIJ22_20640 [Polyangiaceae bacterium]
MRIADQAAKARESEELVEADVPATVVCAHCGDADCPGCLNEQTRSGVVAVVPWERPGASAWARLWATARATTFDADRFFETLPDGPLAPAFRFAIVCELIASTAMGLLLFAPLAVLAPRWVKHLLLDDGGLLLRVAVAGIPALAALLVAAHVAHGWALDLGARRSGSRGATTRALRFGFYAAGWDLVIGPLGAVVVALKEGLRASSSIAVVGMGLPGRSARAFLRGCYRLEGASAQPALRASYAAAVIATAVGTIAVIGALVAALMI